MGSHIDDITFFYHGGQLEPPSVGAMHGCRDFFIIGDVTFFNPGGQLGPCVVDVTDCFQS